MAYTIKKKDYVSMYGPTVGDKIRLGDTDIIIEVEKDFTTYGEEVKFGGGKTIRDGMGQNSFITHDEGALDLLITNAVVLDYTGIYKADVGVRNGKIVGIGKAGNPDIQEGVDSNLVIGVGTEVVAGEGKILTAGGIDTHIHYICPQQVETALAGGMTTMSGGGVGPGEGSMATTCTSGPWNIEMMIKALDDLPMNFVVLGRGNSSTWDNLAEQIEAGAAGWKIHEDWGSTPSVIDMCLTVGQHYDVQVAMHTDTLNEAGDVYSTLAAIAGRCMHTFHSEGAGGGHAPDVMVVAGEYNIIPSSTTPTIPFCFNTVDEHMDMLMVCHHLDKNIKEDVAFAESRIRPETIGAEDILHDMGLIAITTSDSQAMGRVGEVITRTWQVADKMKKDRGPLGVDKENGNDNFRAKRYVSKYTINAAKVCGIDAYIGSIEVGKVADLVLWKPKLFGARPDMVIKSGMVAFAKMGDTNASIPTPEPVIYRKMFGGLTRAIYDTCITFVSKASIDSGRIASYNIRRKVLPVFGCRSVKKSDMVYNDATADIKIDPETYTVTVNGEKLKSKPSKTVPLTTIYNLF